MGRAGLGGTVDLCSVESLASGRCQWHATSERRSSSAGSATKATLILILNQHVLYTLGS